MPLVMTIVSCKALSSKRYIPDTARVGEHDEKDQMWLDSVDKACDMFGHKSENLLGEFMNVEMFALTPIDQ